MVCAEVDMIQLVEAGIQAAFVPEGVKASLSRQVAEFWKQWKI